MKKKSRTKEQPLAEIEDLRRRLDEAEETLRAIQEGEVDALVLSKPQGDVIFTLKGAEHPYRVFVEAMNEGATTLDPEGTILYCNNRFAEILGIPADKVIGSSIFRFIPSTDRSGFESAFQGGKQQDTTVDISLKREDQELIPVHLSFNMLHGQDMPVVCMVAMDLTEHKRLEEALRQLNANLEKRVQDRTAELMKVNETLRAEIVEREKAEEALQESQALLRSVTETTPDPIYVKDRQSRIIMANSATLRLIGKPVEEVIGKDDRQHYEDPAVGGALMANDRRIMESGKTEVIEEIAQTREGYRVFLSTKTPYRNGNGEIIGILGVARDITDRKKVEVALRESEQRWATTLASIGDAVIATDEDGGIRFMNAVAEELTGWTLSEASQKPVKQVFKIINEHTRLEVEDPVAKVIDTGMICGLANHTLLVRKDGTEVAIDDSGAPIRDETGKIMGVVLVFRDISERRKVEKELQRYRDELEMRVQERTHELELINEELKAENEERLKAEIELRESETHLRQVSTELLNAQEKERRLVAQEIHDSIGSTLAATKYKVEAALSQASNNNLQTEAALKSVIPVIQGAIDETRRIQMNLRPAILDDLGILATIGWFCRQYGSTYSAICIRQEIDIKEEEVADSLKTIVFRVLQEAMNNIAKHSKASEVLLHISKIERAIQFVIRDNGQGFDPSETHSRNGTTRGLGLVSMRERVELSGGSYTIESSPGAGTVIRASWPL